MNTTNLSHSTRAIFEEMENFSKVRAGVGNSHSQGKKRDMPQKRKGALQRPGATVPVAEQVEGQRLSVLA